MKFIKKFLSMAEYEAADLSYPATSLVSGTVIYDKELTPQYRTLTTATTCVGYDKYTLEEYQVSMDRGKTWTTTGTSATTLIEADSEDCGYVPPAFQGKWKATYTGGTTSSAECDSSSAITQNEITLANLESVLIGDCVTSIGSLAFLECRSLTSITIPDSVTSIGYNAFSSCSGLTSVTIGNGVTSIDNYAFFNCSSLTSVTIPSGVATIGEGAFVYCPSISSITVDSNNTVYDSRNNCNAIIETSTNTLLVGCKNTVIPNTVTTIGINAFYGCSDLTSITIPDSVTSIGYEAFMDCSGLTSVTIPDSVISIGDSAFDNCQSLTNVTIPNSVTTIGGSAFNDAFGLSPTADVVIGSGVTYIDDEAFSSPGIREVTIYATTPPEIGMNVFDELAEEVKILVPASSLSAYQSASGWSDYADRIQAIA